MTATAPWTTPADLRAQVRKLWDQGALLRPLVTDEPVTPRRLRLVVPRSQDLTDQFDAVRAWMAALSAPCAGEGAPAWRLVLRQFRHRVLGDCALAQEVWIDDLTTAWKLIGEQAAARRFGAMVAQTRASQPAVLAWLAQRPMQALGLADVWPALLVVLAWVQAHPRPACYLREVDAPGVDSKFIEAHRTVLAQCLDLCLPAAAIDARAVGLGGFCQRYGFRDKPLRLRLRVLDVALAWPGLGADQDLTLTRADVAQLQWPVQRVFITENEVNFLAFPPVAGSVVVFGAGYGFDALDGVPWLQQSAVYYWGDIDTHGFAILDQLRAYLPQAQSLLMDSATVLAHRAQWGTEPQPQVRTLTRLSDAEAEVYAALCDDRWAPKLRLEQERIGYGWLRQALNVLAAPVGAAPDGALNLPT